MGAKRRQDIASGRSKRVLVFPWGFQWISGEKELAARWEQVASVTRNVVRHLVYGVHTRTSYYYSFRLADGRSLTIRGVLGSRKARASQAAKLTATPGVTTPVTIEQLGRILEAAVTRVQLPKAIELFSAGQTISFGPLQVSPAGIAAGNQSLTWAEIEAVQTRSGSVIVRKSGKWLMWKSVRVSQIPNYFVFDALVRAILAQQSSADSG